MFCLATVLYVIVMSRILCKISVALTQVDRSMHVGYLWYLMRKRMYVLNAEPMQWLVRPLLDLGSGESGLDVTMYKLSPLCMTKSRE